MKNTIGTIIQTVIDALFPLSGAEKELFSMSPENAGAKLPTAPQSPVQNTYSVFHYKDERVAKMIWNIKYKKSKKAVEIGAYALYEKIKSLPNIENNTTKRVLLIPMPITSRRRKERGYNQCELLLDEVERLFEKEKTTGKYAVSAMSEDKSASSTFSPMTEKPSFLIIFEKNLLERTHHTSRQTLKNRADRLDSAKGIFGLNEKMAEKYSNSNNDNKSSETRDGCAKKYSIVIIDDVITTGSTVKEAMQTMSYAGFEDIIGISVAH